MRVQDVLYFSPKYRFDAIDLDDKDGLIDAFADRVKGFFLQPASDLRERGHSFACGVLCCAVLEFLARYTLSQEGTTGNRFRSWLSSNVPEFSDEGAQVDVAARFWRDFRNGLVHEGRIKSRGQFSFDIEGVVLVEEQVVVVNPGELLDRIDAWFDDYVERLAADNREYEVVSEQLRRDFEREIGTDVT